MSTEHGAPGPGAPQCIEDDRPKALKSNLGIWSISFFVIAAAAPLMCVAGQGFCTYKFGGIGAPLAYLVAGIVLIFFAIGFTAMVKYVKNAGAFYAYILRGLGKPMGVGAAWVALFAYTIMAIGFYGETAYYMELFCVEVLKVNIPWEVWIFVFILLVGVIGYRNVALGAKLVGIFLAAEVILLLILSIAVLLRPGPDSYTLVPFNPENFFVPGIAALIIFSFGAFTGFESTAIYREEANRPEYTIPRATYYSIAFLAVFYSFTEWISTVALGAGPLMTLMAGDSADTLYFNIADDWLGYWALIVMRILVVTSCFACIIGFHNASARYTFCLGRERMMSARFGVPHPRFHSPHVASVLITAIGLVGAAFTAVVGGHPYFELFVYTYGPGVTGLVLCQFLCVVSVIAYFRANRRGHSLWRVAIFPLLGAIGLGISLYLILTNFEYVSGFTGLVNLAFILPVPVIFIGGILMAYWVKRNDPDKYASLAVDLPDELL